MRENRTSGSMSGVGKRDLTLYETIDYRVTLRLYLNLDSSVDRLFPPARPHED
jgi:hypothetical protein